MCHGPAAAGCHLLSMSPQPLADMSNHFYCLNYDVKLLFPYITWVTLMNKCLPHIMNLF